MPKCSLVFKVLIMLCFVACNNSGKKVGTSVDTDYSKDTLLYDEYSYLSYRPYVKKVVQPDIKPVFSKDDVFTNDYNYIADSVMHGHKALLQYYIRRYIADTCHPYIYTKSQLKEGFDGFKAIGKLKHNQRTDSVFVLFPLSLCEQLQSYYFTDTTLPRLQTDAACCHPDNIFSVGDIDEDGVSEIGQYYSSCTSHYKSLYVFTLKNNEWKQVGHSVFDQHYMKYDKSFSSFVRKLERVNLKCMKFQI